MYEAQLTQNSHLKQVAFCFNAANPCEKLESVSESYALAQIFQSLEILIENTGFPL